MRNELVYKKIIQMCTLLDEIDDMIKTQPTELQKIDLELSDWYHYIENNDIDSKFAIKIVKKIQSLRKARRCLCNEHAIETIYKNNSTKVMGNNTRPLLLAEINKTVKQLNNEYKNRVLTQEKISEVLTEKTKKGRPRKEVIE